MHPKGSHRRDAEDTEKERKPNSLRTRRLCGEHMPKKIPSSTATAQPVDLGCEFVDVVSLDDQRGDDLLFVRGNHGSIAVEKLGQHVNGLIAEFIGLLNDGRVDRSVF